MPPAGAASKIQYFKIKYFLFRKGVWNKISLEKSSFFSSCAYLRLTVRGWSGLSVSHLPKSTSLNNERNTNEIRTIMFVFRSYFVRNLNLCSLGCQGGEGGGSKFAKIASADI